MLLEYSTFSRHPDSPHAPSPQGVQGYNSSPHSSPRSAQKLRGFLGTRPPPCARHPHILACLLGSEPPTLASRPILQTVHTQGGCVISNQSQGGNRPQADVKAQKSRRKAKPNLTLLHNVNCCHKGKHCHVCGKERDGHRRAPACGPSVCPTGCDLVLR